MHLGNKNFVRGAVLILVLGMLMILSSIVSLFLSDVMRDTFMRIQLQGKENLRHHAYNALESVISYCEHLIVCNQIIDVKHFVLPTVETLPESIKIQVELTDESGKIPLNYTTQKRLKALFCLFGDIWDGQALMREYWQWLSRKDSSSNFIEKNAWPIQDKKAIRARIMLDESDKNKVEHKVHFPKKLLSYQQLQEIDKFRMFFWDEKGYANEKMERLQACSSLWNTGAVNINSATKDVLEALSKNFFLDLDKIESHLGLTEASANDRQLYKSLHEINELGHGNLKLKQQQGSKESDKKSTVEEDSIAYLTVQPHTVSVRIRAQEADVSFQLNAIFEIESAQSRDGLTKRGKGFLMNKKGGDGVVIKSIKENFL